MLIALRNVIMFDELHF